MLRFLQVSLLFSVVSGRLLHVFPQSEVSPVNVSRNHQADPFLNVSFQSGFMNVGLEGGEMFYWYFPLPDAETTEQTPFFIWLTGGPGCSSSMAALTENGPIKVKPNGEIVLNEFSWSKIAHIVFVDQPLGTGFSVTGNPRNYVTDETTVAADMRQFLSQLIEKYPILKNRPFYITGESYAGHYIPAIAAALLDAPVASLNFKGMAIGNGWVDPKLQYPAYADYAYENKLINSDTYKVVKKAIAHCVDLINQDMWPLAVIQCNMIAHGIIKNRNPYDIRLDCEVPPLCYNETAITNYMNDPAVQKGLGVDAKWKECDPLVYTMLLHDWMLETRTRVAKVADAGYQVLIYSGDQDFICNWRGGERWVNEMSWSKQEDFLKSETEEWQVGSKAAGTLKRFGNLSFLRIYGAGHMVPTDKPEVALEMMKQFVMANGPNIEKASVTDRPSIEGDLFEIISTNGGRPEAAGREKTNIRMDYSLVSGFLRSHSAITR